MSDKVSEESGSLLNMHTSESPIVKSSQEEGSDNSDRFEPASHDEDIYSVNSSPEDESKDEESEVSEIHKINLSIAEKYMKYQSGDDFLESGDKNFDEYGFIISGDNPSGGGHIVFDQDRLKINLSAEKVNKKWQNLLDNWEYENNQTKKRRLFRGIPAKLRSKSWKIMTGIEKKRVVYEGVYEKLVKLAYCTSPLLVQIDKDVPRTFQDNVHFKTRYGRMQHHLFNILSAYSVHNQKVGYTQGMSEIAAMLLLCLEDEEDAFHALSHLMTEPGFCMHGLFTDEFEKFKRFSNHHEKIMKVMLPELMKHLTNLGVMFDMLVLQWFFRCFIYSIPFSLLLRIWDVFMYMGDKIMHPTAYTILKFHKKTLMTFNTMEEANQFLRRDLTTFKYDIEKFMKELSNNITELKSRGLYPVPSSSKTEKSSEYLLSNVITHSDLQSYTQKLRSELKKHVIDEDETKVENSTEIDSNNQNGVSNWGTDDDGFSIPPPPKHLPPPPPKNCLSQTPSLRV